MIKEFIICMVMAMIIAAMCLATLATILPLSALGTMFRFLSTQ